MILSDGETRYELGYTRDGPVDARAISVQNIINGAYTTWYVRRGRVRLAFDGQVIRAKAGDIVLFDPFVTRSHDFTPGASLISVWFKINSNGLEFFPPILPPRIVPRGVLTPSGKESLIAAAAAVCAAHKESEEEDAPASKQWQLLSLFSQWMGEWHALRGELSQGESDNLDPRISVAMRMLAPKITAWKAGRPELLGEVGLSAVHFTRLFRQATGRTPQQWVEDRCYGIAQDMLRDRRYSVKEIAAELGFCDSSHFSRWFFQKTGKRPKQWRSIRGYGHTLAGRRG